MEAVQEPECMMTLMPLRRDDGQVAVDIGYYTSMSRPAQDINLECIRNKQEGGFTHVGTQFLISRVLSVQDYNSRITAPFKPLLKFEIIGSRGSLILTFYEPGSPFDKAIEQWRQGIPMTCQDTAAAEDAATGTSGSVDAGSCTDTEVNFWDSLSDITQLEPVHSPPVINSAASNTAPKSDEPCSGPVNSCATDDGSRCIANLSPGAGNKFYTGTCKPSHFAMNPSGLGSVLVEGQDPIYEINSWIGNTSIPNFVPAMDITAAACPCNCTFVSETCCDAPSGIVHGSAKLKLGELRPEQCSRISTSRA